MATRESSNATAVPQMSAAELSALAKRLRNRAESIFLRDLPEMQRDMLSAAGVIDGVVLSSDLLVDTTDGKVNRSVPLWEAIGDDEEEYADCRQTLLTDGKCTTGGGAAPLYRLELVRNQVTIEMRGGMVAAVRGLPPGTSYTVAYADAEGRSMKIALDLSGDTAMAVAQLCKRFSYDDAARLANRHDGGRERDLIIAGVGVLQRALAEAGFAPR
jgi:hypothetical protein